MISLELFAVLVCATKKAAADFGNSLIGSCNASITKEIGVG